MKKVIFMLVGVLFLAGVCFAQGKSLLIDDFEDSITGGPNGTVDFGAGNGSSVTVTGDKDIKYAGEQSLKVAFDAVTGGCIYVARGFDLEAKNAKWLFCPENIAWKKYNAISFYMYGTDSKVKVAFDVKDNGNENWRYEVEDNFKGWKQIVCNNQQIGRKVWINRI